MPFFSVIIPALNEENYISNILNSLKNQSFKDFEVIVIDSKSTDKTLSIVKSFGKKLALTTITSEIRNISHSRNLGAKKAYGKYLFFIDADNNIPNNFLFEIEKQLKKNDFELIIPATTPNSKKKKYKFIYKIANIFIKNSRKINHPLSTGGNLVIKKELFEKLKGFDESIFVGEDHDIVQRANEIKAKIIFLDNPKVIFSIRRLEKEGGKMIFKYSLSTIYIMLFGKMTKKIYNYEMGGDYFKKSTKSG